MNNFFGDPGGRFGSDVYSIRGDQKISTNNFLYARVGLTMNNKDSYPGALKDGYGPGAWRGNHLARSVVISDTHTFSPSVVNEVKLGYSRDFGYWFDTNYGRDVISQIGLQGISNPGNDPAISGMPSLTFSGGIGFAGTDTWANWKLSGAEHLSDHRQPFVVSRPPQLQDRLRYAETSNQ